MVKKKKKIVTLTAGKWNACTHGKYKGTQNA